MAKYEDYEEILAYSIGTENWFRHWLCKQLVYTDGIKAFAEKMEAFWFIDLVASHMPKVFKDYSKTKNYFYVVKVVVNAKTSHASFKILGVDDEGGNTKVVATQRNFLTDLPAKEGEDKTEYKFYLNLARANPPYTFCLMLTSEY